MRNFYLLLFILSIASCSKDEAGSFIWEKTGGDGTAFYSVVTVDSMFLFVGSNNGNPYAIKSSRSGAKKFSYQPAVNGIFTSAVEDTSGFYLAGATDGDLLLTRLNSNGDEIWSQTLSAQAEILAATVLRLSDDSYIAIASDHPDSVRFYTFLIAYFDSEGIIVETYEPDPGYRVAINDAATGPGGELYLAITKLVSGTKTKASIGRFSLEGLKLWETELYNNPSYGAAALEIDADQDGTIYATGHTELSYEDDLLMNSWIAALAPGGSVSWKNYLENSNTGEEISFDQYSTILVMNRNCGTINYLSMPDGVVSERLRIYDACDPYDTGAKLFSMAVTPDGNYILAGSKSGKFYYALRKGLIYDN